MACTTLHSVVGTIQCFIILCVFVKIFHLQTNLLAFHYNGLLKFVRNRFAPRTRVSITPCVTITQAYFALVVVDVDMRPKWDRFVPYPFHVILELSCSSDVPHWVTMKLIADKFRVASRSIHELELAHFWTVVCAIYAIKSITVLSWHILPIETLLFLKPFELS